MAEQIPPQFTFSKDASGNIVITNPETGESVTIDPRTNQMVSQTPARGGIVKPSTGNIIKDVVKGQVVDQVKNQIKEQIGQRVGEQVATDTAASTIPAPIGEIAGPEMLGSPVGTAAAGQQGVGSTLLNMGSAFGEGAAGAAVPAAIIAQAVLSGKSAYDMLRGKTKKIDQMRMSDIKADPMGTIGRVGLGIATGGLSEIGNSLLSHKSTKDYQNQRREALAAAGVTGLSDFENASKANTGTVVRDPSRAGEWTPWDYMSVLGNAEVFGNDWYTKTEDQKIKAVQAINDAGLYKNNKGDTIISDPNRARQIANDVWSGKQNVNVTTTNPYQNVPMETQPATVNMTPGQTNAVASAVAGQGNTPQQAAPKPYSAWDNPLDNPAYASMSQEQKNRAWADHRKARGATW